MGRGGVEPPTFRFSGRSIPSRNVRTRTLTCTSGCWSTALAAHVATRTATHRLAPRGPATRPSLRCTPVWQPVWQQEGRSSPRGPPAPGNPPRPRGAPDERRSGSSRAFDADLIPGCRIIPRRREDRHCGDRDRRRADVLVQLRQHPRARASARRLPLGRSPRRARRRPLRRRAPHRHPPPRPSRRTRRPTTIRTAPPHLRQHRRSHAEHLRATDHRPLRQSRLRRSRPTPAHRMGGSRTATHSSNADDRTISGRYASTRRADSTPR
ncbi:hypothetical protein FrEUN1fDRAFT_4311 [Parafrankia sp. EUN1f]|nr:hypothetical protein FrEUN1fDRAFT_4311 [Parafrankia sp. EUN1f]